MARSFGIHTGRMELMGLVLSNGVIALAGALIASKKAMPMYLEELGLSLWGLQV